MVKGSRTVGSRARAPSASRIPDRPDSLPVVGIGASAGGLEAFSKLVKALPTASGMAFVLIQHLDPTHPSMMVDLLAKHTPMQVRHAAEGMRLEADSITIIPPGAYLAISGGVFRLSKPKERHGARLPFDFFLRSLAENAGDRAACVILSGTGADGSLGLKAVKENCGLVIAQAPEEAGFDGMPQNAIMTGAVDLVLPVAKIPGALVNYFRKLAPAGAGSKKSRRPAAPDRLSEILDLLIARTGHDFRPYKPGTLQRRIERRMALAAIDRGDIGRYLDLLESDAKEIDLLVQDMLINVTSFFRDPAVFDSLAEKIVPDLVRRHSRDNPLRIWSVGCSSGEEAYSLAILLHEQVAAARQSARLQIFASDIDPDAIAIAREGLYPDSIAADVTPERLARYFTKEDHGYRILQEIRATVVFTVQDVLSDPPFSRLDLISCRNLLIYLRPEAQEKIFALFHFALREGGFLLLGGSESVGSDDDRFEMMSKPERVYRHAARTRPGDLGFAIGGGESIHVPGQYKLRPASRQGALAALCQRLVVENHAPAAALINRHYECLYTLGPTDRYLRVVPGPPKHDIFAMARDGVRTRLRAAVRQAMQKEERILLASGSIGRNRDGQVFDIDIRPVVFEDDSLLLVCFVERPDQEPPQDRPVAPEEASKVAELERELEATRTELSDAVRNLEDMTQEQREINEEALSINEEFQATNEELETSKEELQSLNEELTALNSQLHETLEREKTVSSDLQNVLYSTNVATLFLDAGLNIRFFTPATKSLFSVISSDIGRPLADLQALADDSALLDDARRVLRTRVTLEHEIAKRNGAWYVRRVLPYRTDDNEDGGVVITYTDITERRQISEALEAAKREAERSNLAKSRFLAAASHDLRQPLQTLTLIQGILAKTVEGEKARDLVRRFGETSTAMASMLNALLDLNQIEAGIVIADRVDFPVDEALGRLKDEFAYFARAKGLDLRLVRCGCWIHSDPHLLEQMIRNLVSNALKYTRHGKILIGCRRRKGMVSIEIRDTGVGIPGESLERIFEEYHQLDNAARESSRGLGLGLSIVQRLSDLLGHRVHARSEVGKGSAFIIEVPLAPHAAGQAAQGTAGVKAWASSDPESASGEPQGAAPHATGVVLVVEDDPEVRGTLRLALKDEGHYVVTAADGPSALDMIPGMAVRPDLIIADFNLPNDMNGLLLIEKMQDRFHLTLPAIILTGDISTGTLRDIAQQGCVHLSKPVQQADLSEAIRQLLPPPSSATDARGRSSDGAADGAAVTSVVYVIDDDLHVLEELRHVLEEDGLAVEAFSTAESFLDSWRPGRVACLLADVGMPGMGGLALLERIGDVDRRLAKILITGTGDVAMAMRAIQAGASDFIEKPVSAADLIDHVRQALARSADAAKDSAWRDGAANRLAGLTPRQREIMGMVLTGHPSKNIAADLGLSQRTVEKHRAAIYSRTGVKSLPALARLVVAAGGDTAA